MIAGWAVPQTAACTLAVILGLIPAPTAAGRSLPLWLEIAAVPVGLSALLALLLAVPLFASGFSYLYRATAARWRWVSAWAGATAIGITLESVIVLTVLGSLAPRGIRYPIPGHLSWNWVTFGAGIIATAAAMTGILTSATRSRPKLAPQDFPA